MNPSLPAPAPAQDSTKQQKPNEHHRVRLFAAELDYLISQCYVTLPISKVRIAGLSASTLDVARGGGPVSLKSLAKILKELGDRLSKRTEAERELQLIELRIRFYETKFGWLHPVYTAKPILHENDEFCGRLLATEHARSRRLGVCIRTARRARPGPRSGGYYLPKATENRLCRGHHCHDEDVQHLLRECCPDPIGRMLARVHVADAYHFHAFGHTLLGANGDLLRDVPAQYSETAAVVAFLVRYREAYLDGQDFFQKPPKKDDDETDGNDIAAAHGYTPCIC